MNIESRDSVLWADIFWEDLSSEAQEKLLALMGENGNYNVVPFASVNISPQETK